MSSEQWRASVGFAERMAANMRIKAAYKGADPGLTPSQLAAKASSIEEEVFTQATSTKHYKDLCVQACADAAPRDNAQTLASSGQPAAHPLPVNTYPVEDIGPYKAQYHASGLFSRVYRATDPGTGQHVAVKVTTPRRMSAPHDSEREGRLLKLGSNIAAVIPLLSAEWIAGGHFILVFPFLPCDLGQLLDHKQLTPRQQKGHLHALFEALNHIHGLGIIHRDIKPSNLLSRSPDGPIYLSDFGIAWRTGDPASEKADQKITDVGTTCYRPPELLFGYNAYTEKLDMWAAGCVVAECLLDGKSLFDAGDLGSELALLRSIFTTLGTPTDDTWPEARRMPDWGKMQFTEYPRRGWDDVLPGAAPEGKALVERLVCFQSTERLAAQEALHHPFFDEVK